MRTKYKIITGFVSLLIILAIVAVMGYRALGAADEGMDEFNRFAQINVAFSDTLTAISDADTFVSMFLDEYDDKRILQAEGRVRDADKLMEGCLKDFRDQQDIAAAQNIHKNLIEYLEHLDKVKKGIASLKEAYANRVSPATDTALQQLAFMAQNAFEERNFGLMRSVNGVSLSVTGLRFYTGAYLYTRDENNAKLLDKHLAEIRDKMKTAEPMIRSAAGRAAFNRLAEAINTWDKSTDEMFFAGRDTTAATKAMRESSGQTTRIVGELNDRFDKQMREAAKEISAANASSRTVLLGGSGIGIGIGILAALFIIIGLIKVLDAVSSFATAIAAGDFQAQVHSTEKGEIGAMVAAMRQIPEALQNILNDYGALEKRVEAGELDAKVDPAAYQGGFATVVSGTGAIMDRFLMILEAIPSPVLMMNKHLKLTYVNAICRHLAGGEYKGKTEADISKREDAGAPSDALVKAAQTLQPANAETCAHPLGKAMDITYMAIPLLDHEGKLVSMLELVTDITAIKEAQRKIVRVAEQAAGIANRVAAASEELSAQVEQVSHGAEQQRARVESTAAAMTEMNSSVIEVAKNAGQASEQSETTKNKARDGATLVDKVVHSINLVNTVASTLQTNMHELGKQAKNIGGVMGVISDIADQTNLLALNAAIEAARAGEAGRGFAVVADEVRKLAEKTMNATQEVGQSITAIQESAHTNINEVANAAKVITEATELANTSGKALNEIVELASTSSTVVSSIAAAAEEQSATSEEIHHSIEEVSRIVSETSEGMTQSASAVHELSKMAQELNAVMLELRA